MTIYDERDSSHIYDSRPTLPNCIDDSVCFEQDMIIWGPFYLAGLEILQTLDLFNILVVV